MNAEQKDTNSVAKCNCLKKFSIFLCVAFNSFTLHNSAELLDVFASK